MAEIYFKLITLGQKTIDQVPQNLRAQVQDLLDQSNV